MVSDSNRRYPRVAVALVVPHESVGISARSSGAVAPGNPPRAGGNGGG